MSRLIACGEGLAFPLIYQIIRVGYLNSVLFGTFGNLCRFLLILTVVAHDELPFSNWSANPC